MRLAIDLRSLMETRGRISGVENYLLNILQKLPVQAGDFAFYNSFKDVRMPSLPQDLQVKRTRIPNKILNIAQSFLGTPKLESMYGNFDVLWMPDLRPFAVGKNAKLVVNAHDISPLIHPEFYSLKRRVWHRLISHKKSFERANLIFTISEYTKNDLIRFLGLPESKIKVIYPGIDHDVFRADLNEAGKNEVKQRYNLPEKFILSISTVEPRKNLASLVRAFNLINDPDVELVIAGRLGWLYKSLLVQIGNSHKKDKIHLIGYVSESEKPYLMSRAEIVAYPSFYEGFGFVPLEAMACGVPVVTSTRTSMPEVCGDAAILVDPYNVSELSAGLESLLNDPELRHDFIRKGFELAKRYQWDSCAGQIWQILRNLKQ
ncbi:glycosyltransferase family 4 protein [Patescibacteria group bacterium]|nr:glycosyltransferase family 4 protein [Patescibacteria group bacterium]